MTTREAVLDLRKTHDTNRLVIFVGAGVSRNSGIPTWGELVRHYAERLGINKCNNCLFRESKSCESDNCTHKYNFSTDEYLRIPQYFFDQDASPNKKAYYDIIREVIGINVEPNIIDNAILHAMPHHIITTNYDKLLESANDINTALYTVVSSDQEMISCRASNYIIKMHGDIDHTEAVVLAEKDYLRYETEHVLLSTYIKSLMIDHSFLFVGYSLNDYNLNIILEWFNHLANPLVPSSERPKNYMIDTSEDIPLYRQTYYENKNVWLLKASDLPQELLAKHKGSILSHPGNITYAFLDYIFNEENDSYFLDRKSILYEKYKKFDMFRHISVDDLLKTYPIGLVTQYSQDLRFAIYDNFKTFQDLISSDDEKTKFIRSIFLKAGIQRFTATNQETHKIEYVDLALTNSYDFATEIFSLYLNNKYTELFSLTRDNNDGKMHVYYLALIKADYGKCYDILVELETNLYGTQNWNEWLWVFLNKFYMTNHLNKEEERLSSIKKIKRIFEIIPPRSQQIYGVWKETFEGNHNIQTRLQNKFAEHEQIYLRKTQLFSYASNLGTILEIQAIAYNYYFFFKENYIAIDNFSNPKNILEYYIHAILITYFVVPNVDETLLNTHLNKYELNEIDIDIIIKYGVGSQLQLWITQYNVRDLLVNDESLIDKFCNLCKSYVEYKSFILLNQLHNFLVLISVTVVSEDMKMRIAESLYECIQLSILNFRDVDELSKMINVLMNIIGDSTKISLRKYLNLFMNADVLTGFHWNSAQGIVKKLAVYVDIEIQMKAESILQSEKDIRKKCNLFFCLRNLLNAVQQQKYKKTITKNIQYVSMQDLFSFVIEGIIPCGKKIVKLFIDNVIEQVNIHLANPGIRSFPDPLPSAIEYCVLLHLIKKQTDLTPLKPYINYSDHLFFILNQDSFDYSRVGSLDYMWMNFFRNEKYRRILIAHKCEILTDELKSAMRNDTLTSSQKAILYRYLLNENEVLNI